MHRSLIVPAAFLLLTGAMGNSLQSSEFRLERIAIDAGHGGWDTGARGPRGTTEKEVTLAVALRLAQLLEEESPVRVYMTRRSDFYVPLRERTLIANRHRADLFLSIHCNAMENRTSQGTEIYYCSEKASDRMAALVAERENAVAIEEELPESETGYVDVEKILFRLERKLYWEESSKISDRIIDRMIPQLQTVNRGVKSANFAVLRTAKMPAILVELAFISHPEEERMLRSEAFQERAARAIFEGLRPMFEGGS